MSDTNLIKSPDAQQRLKSQLRLSLETLTSGHGMLVVLICWITMVATGVGTLVAYTQTPGSILEPPAINFFDQHSAILTTPWRLIIGIHPKCPCTLATITELQRLMRQDARAMSCTVLVFVPAGSPANWTDTASVRQSRATPGVEVIEDPDGTNMKRLGIQTSGAVVLYDSHGTPRFHGGITPSRGHEGLNLGVESIVALIGGHEPLASDTPVYGCHILD